MFYTPLDPSAKKCASVLRTLGAFGTKGLRHKAPSALDAFGVTRRGAKRLRRFAPAALCAFGALRLRRFAPAALIAGGLQPKNINP